MKKFAIILSFVFLSYASLPGFVDDLQSGEKIKLPEVAVPAGIIYRGDLFPHDSTGRVSVGGATINPRSTRHRPGSNPVDIIYYEISGFLDPADSTLRGHARIVYSPLEGLNTLWLAYPELIGALDSVASSSAVVDSFYTGNPVITGYSGGITGRRGYSGADSVVVMLDRTIPAGTVDTLEIGFSNLYPPQPWVELSINGERDTTYLYLGSDGWCPRLLSGKDIFTGELSIALPPGWDAYSGAEPTVEEVARDTVVRTWRQDYPADEWPLFAVGHYRETSDAAGGFAVRIAHRILSDEQAAELADSCLAFLERVSALYGAPAVSEITLVETNAYFTNYSRPGLVLFDPYNMQGIYDDKLTSSYIWPGLALELAAQWWGVLVPGIEHPELARALASYTALRFNLPERPDILKNERSFFGSYLPGRDLLDVPLNTAGGVSRVYVHKGGWVLYMLEQRIGRENLDQALADFLAANEGRWACLDELFSTLASYSDTDIGPFLDQWFGKPGLPSLEVSYSFEKNADTSYTAVVEIEQAGTDFTIPIELAARFGTELETTEITVEPGKKRLELEYDERPDAILLDPWGKVLVEVDYPVSVSLVDAGRIFNHGEKMPLAFRLDWPGTLESLYLYYRTEEGAQYDSLLLSPDSLEDGILIDSLPPMPAGSTVEFCFGIRAPGVEPRMVCESGTCQPFSFQVLMEPGPGETTAWLGLDQSGYEADSTFAEKLQAVLRFDLFEFRASGILYDVGCRIIHLDTLRNLLITYNDLHNAIDIVSTENMSLERRLPLGEIDISTTWSECVYDDRSGDLFLRAAHMYRMDLEAGETEATGIGRVAWAGIAPWASMMYLVTNHPWRLMTYDLETGDTEYIHDGLFGQNPLYSYRTMLFALMGDKTLRSVVRTSGEDKVGLRFRNFDLSAGVELADTARYYFDGFSPSTGNYFFYSEYLSPDGELMSIVATGFVPSLSHFAYVTSLPDDLEGAGLVPVGRPGEDHGIYGNNEALAYTASNGRNLLLFYGEQRALAVDPEGGEVVRQASDVLTGPGTGGRQYPGHYDLVSAAAPYTPGALQGDFNNDGSRDVSDLVLMLRAITSEQPDPHYDLNKDGKVDITDLIELLGRLTRQGRN